MQTFSSYQNYYEVSLPPAIRGGPLHPLILKFELILVYSFSSALIQDLSATLFSNPEVVGKVILPLPEQMQRELTTSLVAGMDSLPVAVSEECKVMLLPPFCSLQKSVPEPQVEEEPLKSNVTLQPETPEVTTSIFEVRIFSNF